MRSQRMKRRASKSWPGSKYWSAWSGSGSGFRSWSESGSGSGFSSSSGSKS